MKGTSRVAHIFDLDDTLIRTNSHIYVYHQESGELLDKINSRDYVHKRSIVKEYYQQGCRVNTDEFGSDDALSYQFLYNGETLEEQLALLKEVVKKMRSGTGSVDLYVVTGRGNAPGTISRLFAEKFGIEIAEENIYPVSFQEKMQSLWAEIHEKYDVGITELLSTGKSAANFKKSSFFDIMSKKYDEVYLYDDDHDNILCFQNLVDELNRLGFAIQAHAFTIGA